MSEYIKGSGGGGKGGGGSSRTPVEAPDSLHNNTYATFIDVIANGETYGPATGDILSSTYIDETPIKNADGTLNFRDTEVSFRNGEINQEYISGFPSTASTTPVGVEVKQSQPWVKALNNADINAVRVSLFWPQLVRTTISGGNAGDRNGAEVDYAIDLAIDGGSFVEKVRTSVNGKTVNGFTRTHRVELTSGTSWQIRVRRITEDSTDSNLQDKMSVSSYSEVIDAKLAYPMTALVGMKINAEQFQSLPTRGYHWKGAICQVPSNYDVESRTYYGIWDGTFKRAWTDNPAWHYYYLLTDPLAGVGEKINGGMIDRYALYQIGVYCDEMVDDGFGGLEPRFTCDAYIQGAKDALRVLNDLTSVFRGISYWANDSVYTIADRPSDPVYTFTNAKVVGGLFEYVGSGLSTVKTVALVSYNDPKDFYRQKVEAVHDKDGIQRYGVRKTQVSAFGCTTRGQAQRVGLYQLYTSMYDSGGLSFSTGLEGFIPPIGSIIQIADNNRAGVMLGGLIKSQTGLIVELDREIVALNGDLLTFNLPSGSSETVQISSVDGAVVTLKRQPSEQLQAGSSWALDRPSIVTQLARVLSVKENENLTYTISAVLHHPQKFNAIDNGVKLEPLPVSVIPARVQKEPTNIELSEYSIIREGVSSTNVVITWDKPEGSVKFDVQYQRDNGSWIQMPLTYQNETSLFNVYSGEYLVRVRAYNALDVPSLWAYSDSAIISGITTPPPRLTSMTAMGGVFEIDLRWSFPAVANIVSKTEVKYSLTSSFADAASLGEYAYPTNSLKQTGLKPGLVVHYWARLVDKNGLKGEWYPLNSETGVSAQVSDDANEYLDLITKEIVESALGDELLADIGKIPSLEAGVDKIPALGIQVGKIPAIQSALNDNSLGIGATNDRINGLQQTVQDIINGELSD